MKRKVYLIALLFLITYFNTFIWMWDRWFSRDSYYTHGILVPFITGFLIYKKKDRLKTIPKGCSPIGLWVFLSGIALQLIASFWRVHFISGFSIPIVIFGTILYLYGKEFTKEILFPLSFLIFMIPLPLIVIAELSLKLKLLTTKLTVFISNLFGISVVNEGNILYFHKGHMVVGDVCSGLRSLVSLLGMGALYGYLLPVNRLKKFILFISAIPISIVSNMVRMFVLCIIANLFGVEYTGGFIHDATGILIYITAFGLLFSMDKLFLR